jgi:hypothetical protein
MGRMTQPQRPHLPEPIRREVLVETGYRCAIPTCQQIPVDVHHIDGDRTNHAFDNLVALCPNHRRADRQEIPRLAVTTYKRNLGLITGPQVILDAAVLPVRFPAHTSENAVS